MKIGAILVTFWRYKMKEKFINEYGIYNDYYEPQEVAKRKVLTYHGAKNSIITQNEIESSIKNNIGEYSKWINNFVGMLTPLLSKDYCINEKGIIFEIQRKYGEESNFENDGNTSTEGFNYEILWAYPLGDTFEKSQEIRQGYAQSYLYFTYECSERVRDHKENGSRFFSIYVAGFKLPRQESYITRIDYNNNNMALNSILNKKSLIATVLEIRKNQPIYELFNKVNKLDLLENNW